MDVERLRISHAVGPRTRPVRWGWVIVTAVGCVGVGFVLGRVTARGSEGEAVSVASAVALPREGSVAGQFMASGWVEVPTPRYPIVVTARVTERLAALYVHEGEIVTSGMVVAQLYDQDLRKQSEAALATFLAASNRAARLESGYRDEDIAAARAGLSEAAERLRSTSARYERVRAMLRAQVVSTDEYEGVYTAYRQAEAGYALAEAQWRKRAAGYRAEEVAQARAEAAAAEAAWHLAQRAVEQCTVRVPAHPRPLRVLSVRRSVGEWITAGEDGDPTLMTLYDPRELHVRVDVSQANIGSVETGMPVLITTETAGRRRYRGRVLRIEPRANLAKNTITVRVTIEEPDELLFPDMLCQVTFLELSLIHIS
ncbi:MAG: HlyD family efflux transporter periplasmic adaptor subunit, partial [bacterium]|nr:HlyD family efflux transporter periplasmic adaptor subunit [bacterium]